jgi:uroporphyrinogen decarboxylase
MRSPSWVNVTTRHFEGATMMNKRDTVLEMIHSPAAPAYVPAAFFMHFDRAAHQGQAAIDQHLAFFRTTGMDFVKIQYEQTPPTAAPMRTPADWAHAPRCDAAFFEASIRVAEGLVNAAKDEALVIMTLYSPFMWAAQLAGAETLAVHLRENPDAVRKGLEIMTDNVLTLVRGCRRVGVDGFYVSSQGGEAFRFPGTEIFRQYIKPTDLAVWDEVQSCAFNILHICDYAGPYADLTPFLDYGGHVVNCSLALGDRTFSPKDVAQMFGRPFMGGLERLGVIATGSLDDIRQAAEDVLAEASDRFILAADCTIPSATPWDHVKAAIDTAHQYRK